MHRLVGPHSVLNSIFSCFYETTFRLVWILLFLVLAQLIQLPNTNPLLFDPLLPNFQLVIFFLLLPLAFLLPLLHPEYLRQERVT